MPVAVFVDDPPIIGGYGLLFGDDGAGVIHDPAADYMLDLVPRKPVLIAHAGDPVGWTFREFVTPRGIFVLAQLQDGAPGLADLLPDIRAGRVGFSRGIFLPLVKHDERDRRRLLRAPIVEYSLTRAPADPRQLGIEIDSERARRGDLGIVFVDEGGGWFSYNHTVPVVLDVVRRLARDGYDVSVISQADPPPEFVRQSYWRVIKNGRKTHV